jgi:uncharacterized protein YdbL (DUF1318 family)
MNKIWIVLSLMMSFLWVNVAVAAADLEVNTPAIATIKSSMQTRHSNLAPFYSSGVVGLTQDGKIAVKDASAVPLKDRGAVNSLVSAENTDRTNLYQEIANANGHPEWQADIQSTFASRWVDKAQAGWFYQHAGAWVKK